MSFKLSSGKWQEKKSRIRSLKLTDFLGSDQNEDEEDDADTIEEEPDFSCGSEEGLSSESAEDSETENEETQMKSKRYKH